MLPPLKNGEVLRGRYKILERIGQGGMGSIYLADDTRLKGRQCALKEVEYDRALPENIREEARDQFLREAAVGQGPDVVHSAFVWTKEYGTAGAVRALDDLIAKDPLPKGLDDFIAIDLARANGKVYGIPWTADTWAMAYRTDLLKAAGVEVPDTWADLKAASAAVKAKKPA